MASAQGPARVREGIADIRPAKPDMFSPVSTGRISEVIVEQVRQLMRQRQLKPGDRLPAERELCEQFGVSRVSVREALRMLESEGLVYRVPGLGYYVTEHQ